MVGRFKSFEVNLADRIDQLSELHRRCEALGEDSQKPAWIESETKVGRALRWMRLALANAKTFIDNETQLVDARMQKMSMRR